MLPLDFSIYVKRALIVYKWVGPSESSKMLLITI